LPYPLKPSPETAARPWLRPALWGLLLAALVGVAGAGLHERLARRQAGGERAGGEPVGAEQAGTERAGGEPVGVEPASDLALEDGRERPAAAARAADERQPAGSRRAAALPRLGGVPGFALANRDGRTVRLADLAGAPWIADFVFTGCGSSCPMLSARMAGLDRTLPAGPGPGPRLRLVSFSVDPVHDTPAVLERYARSFGAKSRWLFLTGDPAQIRALTRQGFKLALEPGGGAEGGAAGVTAAAGGAAGTAGGGGPTRASGAAGGATATGAASGGTMAAGGGEAVLHSTRFVLVDAAGVIRGYYPALQPEALRRLAADARALLAGGGEGDGGSGGAERRAASRP
jgi:cytochrome oxidase Cu insertion factor (SCO1/SenC/PrrC family)